MRNCWSSRLFLGATLASAALLTIGCGKSASDDAADVDAGAGGEAAGGSGGAAGGSGGMPVGGTPVGGEIAGGAGGEGGAGGAGGSTVPTDECGEGVAVGVLTLDGDSGVYEGQTGGEDTFFASCTPPEQAGSEGVVKFTAPTAGYWRFTSEGTVWDSVVYALEDCNDGFTELTCNDDISDGDNSSSILLEMTEGQTTYLFVDQVGAERVSAFKLSAEKINAAPPSITEFHAYYSDVTGVAGLRIKATDPEGDITKYRWGVFGADGMQIPLDQAAPELEAAFDDPQLQLFSLLQNEDGSFSIEGVAAPQNGFPQLSKMSFQLGDANGLWGETVESDIELTDVMRAHGETCDPARVLDACPETDACADADADGEAVCETATAPTVTTSEGYYNGTTNGLGVRIIGTDPENNVAAIRFTAHDAAGAEVFFGDGPGAVQVGVYQAQQADGNFEAHFAFAPFFQGLCLPGAQAHFDECSGNMRPQDVCIEEANAILDMCNRETAATITRLNVVLVDATLKATEAFDVNIGAPPVVEAGGACDAVQATGACPEGHTCGDFAPGNEWDTCVTTDSTTCPEHYNATDLTADNAEGPWTVTANNGGEGVEAHGGGSCGGGGPSLVYSFTTPAAGNYSATTSRLGENVDSLMFVRSSCALYGNDVEIGCSDDIDTQGGNFASSVDFMAEAGQTFYIFVDSYNGQFPGAFTLTVTGP
jgi:hypothetical protein